MLQSGITRIRQDSVIQLRQRRHLHTKTVNKLEKVKKNRTALDIKSRLVFIYEEALVYL